MNERFQEAVQKAALSLHHNVRRSHSFRIEIRFPTRELYEAYREGVWGNFPHNYLFYAFDSVVKISGEMEGFDADLYRLRERGHKPPKWEYDPEVAEWLGPEFREWLGWPLSPS